MNKNRPLSFKGSGLFRFRAGAGPLWAIVIWQP